AVTNRDPFLAGAKREAAFGAAPVQTGIGRVDPYYRTHRTLVALVASYERRNRIEQFEVSGIGRRCRRRRITRRVYFNLVILGSRQVIKFVGTPVLADHPVLNAAVPDLPVSAFLGPAQFRPVPHGPCGGGPLVYVLGNRAGSVMRDRIPQRISPVPAQDGFV